MSFFNPGPSLFGTVGPHTDTVVLCLEGIVAGHIRYGVTEGKEEPVDVVPARAIDEQALPPGVSVALDGHENVVVSAQTAFVGAVEIVSHVEGVMARVVIQNTSSPIVPDVFDPARIPVFHRHNKEASSVEAQRIVGILNAAVV
jgi:hypothetical protein